MGTANNFKRTILSLVQIIILLFTFSTFPLRAQTFTKVTHGPVANDIQSSIGCSWGDFNKDGLLDLFVANWDLQINALYLNTGGGSFNKITSGSIVSDTDYSRSSCWGDYDNDGDLDLFVANSAGNNSLYANNGDNTFTKITSGDIVTDFGDSYCGSWVDYDNDGDLDLFVGNIYRENNFLYENNGNGTFTKIFSGSIVNDGSHTRGCSWGDYDNDGYIDLFIANSHQPNALYHNNGDKTFTQIFTGSIVNDIAYSYGCSWGDYNNDGYLDMFVANVNGQDNFLYKNNGDGTFTKITNDIVVNDGGDSRGSCWGDFDNDGDLDLFVANVGNQNNFLYLNNGNETFTKVTSGIVVNDGGVSYGSSCCDFDQDGDLDLFVANYQNENNFLYANNGNSNNWINIKCAGTTFENYSAIGTRVQIKAAINGTQVWQVRQISAQTGHGSQNSTNLKFGLGNATVIDSLIVDWPAAGIVQVLTQVAVNQFLTLQEPKIPILWEINPNEAYQGQDLIVTITGRNTHFSDSTGTQDVWLSRGGTSIHATTFTDSSNTVLSAAFSIPTNAPTGSWDMNVQTAKDSVITRTDGFAITLPPPVIFVTPQILDVQVNQGDSLDEIVTIVNQGVADLLWSAKIGAVKRRQQHTPGQQTEIQRGSEPSSIGVAPKEMSPVLRKKESRKFPESSASWAYGVDVYSERFIKFNLTSPFNIYLIAPNNTPLFAGDFDQNGIFYVVDGMSNILFTLDTLSGALNYIGNMNIPMGQTITGISYDISTSTLYASSTDIFTSGIYTVDLSTGATTLVGMTSAAPGIIDIAINQEGELFAHDIVTDAIYRVDKATGAAVFVGLTGFDANFAQGMDFDPATDDLYLAAFNNLSLEAQLRLVDTSTGYSTLVGPISYGYDAEVAAFGIAGSFVPPFVKLLEPTSGTIVSNDHFDLKVRFYGVSEVSDDTSFSTNILITSNDPVTPLVVVPVHLSLITGIRNNQQLPQTFAVNRNYPNPFNPATTIKYQLPEAADVNLAIYDILGRKVRTLVNRRMTPGYYSVVWNGRNDSGGVMPSGLYIYRFEAGDFQKVHKMILLK